MKKLVISLAIISALGLSGCGSETIEDVKNDAANNLTPIVASARVVFDPGADEPRLSIPNDLLFTGHEDGTLNVPDENLIDKVTGEKLPIDYLNPSAAVGALDGWSTINPFVLDIDFPQGTSLNGDSAFSPNSVRIFETLMGGDPGCEQVPVGAACIVVGELTWGVDFITQASGNSVAVVPLKPLKGKTSYILALTSNLKDNNGKAISGSTTYESVRQDITTHPLATPTQLGLQGAINSYENAIVAAGADKDNLIYTMAMTTQSIQDVSQVVKSLMLSGIPGTTPILSAINPTGANAAMLLGLDANDFGAGTQASFASVSKSTLSAPYYLETPYYDPNDLPGSCDLTNPDLTIGCADLFSRWTAMGDSPVTVLGALQKGVLTQQAFAEQAAAQGQDAADLIANPTKLVGLTFNVAVSVGDTTVNVAVDQARHLTQYNPLPQVKSYKNDADGSALDVFITMPDVDRINAVAALKKGAALTPEEMMAMPDSGWPIMIYSHGITSYKETVLAIAGTLASQGIATIAIDHPYHGERGIDFNGDGVYEISSSESLKGFDPRYANASVTSYMNLSSLLTARDNVRQSEVDLLALRLSLNSPNLAGQLDATKVSFLGHSLGGFSGIVFTALANSGVVNPATGGLLPINPYAINSASYAFPGGGIPGILLNSASFAPAVMAGLTTSDDFIELVEAAAGKEVEDLTEEEYAGLVAAIYPTFASEFNFAAQTIMDAADPINYATTVQATMTPVHLMEIVGDETLGGFNKADQVIVNATASLPLVGTEPLIRALALTGASDTVGDGTTTVSAAVRFLKGHHSSILSPATVAGVAEDADANLAVTIEMQTQIAAFSANGGKLLLITDNQHIVPATE